MQQEESKTTQIVSGPTDNVDSGGEGGGKGAESENFTELEIEEYQKVFPSRNTFSFEKGLTVTSDFDQGNLALCQRVPSKFDKDGSHLFEMQITPDSWPYMPEISAGRAGFFFSVSGLAAPKTKFDKSVGQDVQLPRMLRFHFKGMSNQTKLLSWGHTPVYLEVKNNEYLKLIQGKLPFYKQKWKRICEKDVEYTKSSDNVVELIFSLGLKPNFQKTDHILFAYAYPYTYQDCQYSIDEIEDKCFKNENVFFEREVVANSIEGRDLTMMTISTVKAVKQNKPVIFFTGRVHCGESPASYMLQGVLDKLMDFSSRQTQILLQNYVFKVIPMLNPDGVSRGYWRYDTQGLNLNRFWAEPKPDLHPTIYGAKDRILIEHAKKNLKMYVDFHAHCTKRSCFIFGNTLQDPQLQTEAMMIPKLMSMNSPNFDFSACNFQDEKNNVQDAKGDSRDGSARASIFRETDGNPLTYTFEANYCTGLRFNPINQRFDIENDKKIIKEDTMVTDITSQIYKGRKSPIFTPEVYFEVGQSLLIALLDYDCINPVTRLIKKKGETLSEAVDKIRRDMNKKDETELAPYIKKTKVKTAGISTRANSNPFITIEENKKKALLGQKKKSIAQIKKK